ncbi:MAG: hypothetical protein NC299_12055 [Lachnospiraceae bacterium]|nr:hypothetical protein [Ruminococcus sp.]MCM1276076.1 hypothetical protein [Lachnospiraceae bacterium]
MTNVSDTFRALAEANGRYVCCKITAGGETFLDDRILEFDFDDVIHPERFTIGTACSNKFCFSVMYDGELDVRDEVRPYISFDGREWCPLGVFYVSRRYVRGGYASITCYDKMYYLNAEYTPTLRVPTTTDAILHDACAQGGITCAENGGDIAIRRLPRGYSIRDIISFIASINCASAKFDRNGALVFKKTLPTEGVYLREKNCVSINRNMTTSFVAGVIIDADGKAIESGSSAVESAAELYNPMMTQEIADSLAAQLKDFRFYGARIKMQGLPYLESGDNIMLEESDGGTYPITISEIEYHYDGGLSATLHSRNTSPEKSELQSALEELSFSTDIVRMQQVNSYDLAISTVARTLAEYEFTTDKRGKAAMIDINYTLLANEGTELTITIAVNDVQLDRTVTYKPVGGRLCFEHYHYLADDLPKGNNRITVKIAASSGAAQISAKQSYSTLLLL